jgi:hypothetical protein
MSATELSVPALQQLRGKAQITNAKAIHPTAFHCAAPNLRDRLPIRRCSQNGQEFLPHIETNDYPYLSDQTVEIKRTLRVFIQKLAARAKLTLDS